MLRSVWRSLVAHRLRLAMSAVAVVLGVAFVAGSLIFTDMLSGALSGLLNGSFADVQVRAAGASDQTTSVRPVWASTVTDVRRVPGVASAQGTVTANGVYVIGRDGKVVARQGPPSVGASWVDAPAFGGQQGLHVVTGRSPRAWGEVAVDPGTLDRAGYRVGDTVRVATPGRYATVQVRVVGTATWGGSGGTAGATYAFFDPRTAQRLFHDGRDEFDGVWVTVEKGRDLDAVTRGVQAVLPRGLEAVRGDALAKRLAGVVATATGFVTTFLLVFAGIALVVGSFLIVNTFSILVAQRARELALLRALGASRAQVRRSVLLEAGVVGVVGSTAGLLAGVGIARGIAALFARVGLDLGSAPLRLTPRTVVASYAVGVVVTMLAAYVPARRAAAVPPVAAMSGEAATGQEGLGRRAAVGTAAAALGLVVLLAGMLGTSLPSRPALVGGGALLLLLGTSAASPVLGMPVTRALGLVYERSFGAVGRLAYLNAVRNPRRTAATASALMIGLTLVTAMSVLGQSMKASTRATVTENLRADYVASSVGLTGFPPSVGDRMARVPGVASVHRTGTVRAVVGGERTRLTTLDADGFDKVLAQHLVAGSATAWRPGTAHVGQDLADTLHLRVGSTVTPRVGGQDLPLRVVGILDRGDVLGGVVTPAASLDRLGLARTDTMVAVTRAPGADPAAVRRGLEAAVADLPMVTVTDQQEYADEQAKGVDQLLAIVYGLLALAIVIAVLGIVNTLGLSVIERTREIGLLRAVGLSRPQLRRMIRLESVVIALLGSVLGVALGLLLGVALQRALAGDGLTRLRVPWAMLAGVLAVAVVVGVLAAVWPARRAARLDVLDAIDAE